MDYKGILAEFVDQEVDILVITERAGPSFREFIKLIPEDGDLSVCVGTCTVFYRQALCTIRFKSVQGRGFVDTIRGCAFQRIYLMTVLESRYDYEVVYSRLRPSFRRHNDLESLTLFRQEFYDKYIS